MVDIYFQRKQIYIIKSHMQEIRRQIKILIHQILCKHKIYRLQIHDLHHILSILQQNSSEQPQQIQQAIFRGIYLHNKTHRDQIGPSLTSPHLSHVPVGVKALLHKVLHQFHFLNEMKAWEMYADTYQAPITSRNLRNESQIKLFDDQFEKARIHFNYYGPIGYSNLSQNNSAYFQNMAHNQIQQYAQNIPYVHPQYHYGNQYPTYNVFPSQHFINPNHQNHPNNPNSSSFHNDLEQQPSLNENSQSRKMQASRQKVGSYPLKNCQQKIKQNIQNQQKPKKTITKQLFLYLSKNYDPSKISSVQNEQFKQCPCKGFIINQNYFICQCQSQFHSRCVGGYLCWTCKITQSDLFIKNVEVIKKIYFDWNDETMSISQKLCLRKYLPLHKQFRLAVGCTNESSSRIIWLDNTMLKINDQPICQFESLQLQHQKINRFDAIIDITQYVLAYFSVTQSTQLDFSIELIKEKAFDPSFRNNRQGKFQVVFFIAEYQDVTSIMSRVFINSQKSNAFSLPPFQYFDKSLQVEIDRLQITQLDAYSREHISIPVRGAQCLHYQCFDLETFLLHTFHSKFRTWACPLCKKDARKLFIDTYQHKILDNLYKKKLQYKNIIFWRSGEVDYISFPEKSPEQKQKQKQ